MRRLSNILGLLFLIYLVTNYRNWHIIMKENNIISSIIVKPLQWLPNGILLIIMLSIIILYIKTIIYDEKNILLQITTFTLVTIIGKICISVLMLENITEFSLFYVKHPVPIELKLLHFKYTLSSALESIPKERLIHMYNILGQDLTKIGVFLEEIKNDIKELNAIEIRDYTQQLLNLIEWEHNSIVRMHLLYIAFGLSMVVFISMKFFSHV